MCLLFSIIFFSFSGGILSNSLALVTDATHMASDLAGFMVSLCAIWMATKPTTMKMSFGFYRAGKSPSLVYTDPRAVRRKSLLVKLR